MFIESDLLPISALQHLLFCPRQCALIHLEQVWVENRWTIEGRQLHEKAHRPGSRAARDRPASIQSQPATRVTQGMQLRSLEMGLFGQADVVEFSDDRASSGGMAAFPIEYKRGKPKTGDEDRVQLCAQAMCIEEMLAMSVPAGAIFYGRTRRRVEVAFDLSLRQTTRDSAARLHELVAAGRTPAARREKKCERCSLLHECMPNVLEGREPASRYLHRVLSAVAMEGGPTTDAPV